MKINYNDWFYDQHKYLTSSRDGTISFTDTKWVNINKRYQNLVNLQGYSSQLLNQQPFAVVGNNAGFDALIDLLARSNYSFEDLNESLAETYKASLTNAMSRMVVNTQAVMFRTTNMNRDNTYSEKSSRYYIIDAPFNQLHFGDRDEFIRQKLHEMHETENDHYIDIDTFNSSSITKILGFTIICTINGMFCNDCKVAMSDKGLKFKIGWPYSSDVEFIVYKLDESFIIPCETLATNILSGSLLTYSELGITEYEGLIGQKCILNIYDKNYAKTTSSVPNFGEFDREGLNIKDCQNKTKTMLKNILHSKTASMTIYVIKYLYEIPNTYPAVNYYDLMDSRKVYTEDGNPVKNLDGGWIIGNKTLDRNELEVCTPPIVLDRFEDGSTDGKYMTFETITRCLSLYNSMKGLRDTIVKIGNYINSKDNYPSAEFKTNVTDAANSIVVSLNDYYLTYVSGANITSLVSPDLISDFESLIEKFNTLGRRATPTNIQSYTFDELYGGNYLTFVNKITAPFRSSKLKPFTDMGNLTSNYFKITNKRFNRPVSEQCFITLRYSRDEECWLFDYPRIKHFHGIGNAFYIDSELNGNELFKFFVLYTDTESPIETEVEPLEETQILDFDLFCKEVEKHLGYIRYWYAENKLMKISRIMYGKYDQITATQVLSKILKRKILAEDILDKYPSEINYEDSNISSDNWENYTEDSERSPFAINFLFYTLNMLYENEDQMQSFFMTILTKRKFTNRYSDIDVTSMLDDSRYPVNFSKFCIIPNYIETASSNIPHKDFMLFYGLGMVHSTTGVDMTQYKNYRYRYSFNVLDLNLKFWETIDNDLSDTYYISYVTPGFTTEVSYHNDIRLARLLSFYLCDLYQYISLLQTNYRTPFNANGVIESAKKTMTKRLNDILNFIDSHEDEFVYDRLYRIISALVGDGTNPFISILDDLNTKTNDAIRIAARRNNQLRWMDIFDYVEDITVMLKRIYVSYGFDNSALKRARALYIHLKSVHKTMNTYEFKQWLNNIDLEFLRILDSIMATNENYARDNIKTNPFSEFYRYLNSYINNAPEILDDIDATVKSLSTTFRTTHIDVLTEYLDFVLKHFVFDLYILDNVSYDKSITYSRKPSAVVLTIQRANHNHFAPPYGERILNGDVLLVFQPIIDEFEDYYTITNLSKITEFCFFSGEPISNVSMKVIDEHGQVIQTSTASITFAKVGSTSDMTGNFNQIINVHNLGKPNEFTDEDHHSIDFENIHESYDIAEDGSIITKKHADMNYELLIGNHFTQLEHTEELVLQPNTWLQGSIDRLYISNQMINNIVARDYGQHVSSEIYFKPTQVLHIPIIDSDEPIASIGGKYYVGQHLYAKTTDEKYMFPIIVTTIDHSTSHGFIEAKVDNLHAKWFKLDNGTDITQYLTEDIECEVLDDNMCNFIDEFANPNYVSYPNVMIDNDSIVYNENGLDAYTLPGDPVFVNNNAGFVYTRLNWIFNDLVPNRFIDDEHKQYRFQYLGTSTCIGNEIRIKMLSQQRNPLTKPEMYPILRSEPNDHDIWKKEIAVFTAELKAEQLKLDNNSTSNPGIKQQLVAVEEQYRNAETMEDKNLYAKQIEELELKKSMVEGTIKRLNTYLEQLEYPTTWFNVLSYEAAIIYIDNGRADQFSPSIITDTRDMLYTIKSNVFLYDWEHKHWIDPGTYSVDPEIVHAVKNDTYDEYTTNNVLYAIRITPSVNFPKSRKILVYIGYKTSDLYDPITINQKTFNVRFKPILSLESEIGDFDPYGKIRIRKHFDGNEKYLFTEFNAPEDFSITDAFMLKRPKRNGKYTYSPTMRFCDVSLQDGETLHGFEDLDLYIRFPFKDVETLRHYSIPKYTATINQPIDTFVEGQNVKLICVQNNNVSSYNGNISNVMFEATTSLGENDEQTLTITGSTLHNYDSGTFICTVLKDDTYVTCGGLITISVHPDTETLMDDGNAWIRVPSELAAYKELPKEFIIVPHFNITMTNETKIYITLHDAYVKEMDDTVSVTNDNLNNPFEYYFDIVKEQRYPLSNTRKNAINERLVIDQTLNPNVKLVKAPYIGICRYSLHNIPKNGFVDLTGYIPTELSRDRYEFWVNGRYIDDPNDIIILSPSSIQLCNLKSLHNLEVVELVDDFDDNIINRRGSVYVDLNGNCFGSYYSAMVSNSMIRVQDMRYLFNTMVHQSIHDYTNNIIPDPNNKDLERDILDNLVIDNSGITNYNELYNIPTINGVSIYHPTLDTLGMLPAPNEKIIEAFDKAWKFEEITNPLFITTHKTKSLEPDYQTLYMYIRDTNKSFGPPEVDDMFLFYSKGTLKNYFSLYISTESDGVIDDREHTVKIIPFIRTGVYVFIEKAYKGHWLHSTFPNSNPIRIQ